MVPTESLKIIASFFLFPMNCITENVEKHIHCIDTDQ